MITRLVHIVLLTLLSVVLYAQQGSITAKWDDKSVEIKWYTKTFINYNGVNVFRKINGNWEQINTALIKPNTSPTFSDNAEIQFVNSILKKKRKIEGIVLLNAMAASFKYSEISKNTGIYFEDKSAPRQSNVSYKVVDKSGALIAETTLDLTKSFAVKTPGKFKVKRKRKEVKMYWASDPMQFYAINVYAKINGEIKKLNEFPLMASDQSGYDTSQRFQYKYKLEENTNYEFFIKGVGYFNDESIKTKSIVIKLGDITPPATPHGLDFSQSGKNKVHLKWSTYSDTSAANLAIYRGLYYDSLVRVKTVATTVNKTTDVSPISGDLYYAIGSEDVAGNVSLSERIIVHVEDMFAPDAPTGLTAIADSGKVYLTWDTVTTPDLSGYVLYRSGGAGKEFRPLNADPILKQEYTFKTSMRTKSTMQFYVVAMDSAYNKSKPFDTVAIHQPDYIPPIKPLIKNVSVQEKGITLYWLANTESDLDGYELYCKDLSDTLDFYKLSEIGKSFKQYTDTTIIPSHKYQYYMLAKDTANNKSKRSNIFTADAPRFKTYTDQTFDVKWKYKVKSKKLTLKWKPQDVTGYVLFKKQEKSSKQKTGLIKQTKYTIFEVEKTEIWQVVGYAPNGQKHKSQLIEVKNKKS